MIIKILLTVLVLGINYLVYKFLDKKVKLNLSLLLLLIMISAVIFYIYDSFSNITLSKQILIFVFIFSAILIILLYIMKGVSFFLSPRYEKINANIIEKYKVVTSFLKREMIVLLITLYQLLLIWNPSIIENINNI